LDFSIKIKLVFNDIILLVKHVSRQIEPYLMVNGTDSWTGYYGMIVDTLHAIERIADVTFELTVVPDGKFGSLTGGTWDGMIGQIINDVSGIVSTWYHVSYNRR